MIYRRSAAAHTQRGVCFYDKQRSTALTSCVTLLSSRKLSKEIETPPPPRHVCCQAKIAAQPTVCAHLAAHQALKKYQSRTLRALL